MTQDAIGREAAEIDPSTASLPAIITGKGEDGGGATISMSTSLVSPTIAKSKQQLGVHNAMNIKYPKGNNGQALVLPNQTRQQQKNCKSRRSPLKIN